MVKKVINVVKALDPGNSPGWDILDPRMAHKLPLFSHSLVSYKSPVKERQSEVACGASYTLLVPTPTRTLRPVRTPKLDNAPRVGIVILILPSDTLFGDDLYCICFDHPNRETTMLSTPNHH